jgi:hypothetical protein
MADYPVLDKCHIHVFSDTRSGAGAVADEESRNSFVAELSREGAGVFLVSFSFSLIA